MNLMERAPSAFAWWLQAAEFYASAIKQVVIVGERDNPDTQVLVARGEARFQSGSNRGIDGAG